MKVSYRSSANDKLTDFSGTISTGGVSQLLCPANNDRCYFFLQNLSSGDLWINFSADAAATQPSIRVRSGADATEEGNFVTSESISVWGATSGQAFTCKTGS